MQSLKIWIFSLSTMFLPAIVLSSTLLSTNILADEQKMCGISIDPVTGLMSIPNCEEAPPDTTENDVGVLLSSTFSGEDEVQYVTYTAVVENYADHAVDNVELSLNLPNEVHFLSNESDSRCSNKAGNFVGGSVQCKINLESVNNSIDANIRIIDIKARLLNAGDLQNATAQIKVTNDINSSNNESTTYAKPTLKDGSISQTWQLLKTLDQDFDYKVQNSDLLDKQCDVYMNDIFGRFENIRSENPSTFKDLSYAKVTSGTYYVGGVVNKFTRAGHVGVVVYPKGTNYHKTGIIIHGTPTTSPVDLDLNTRLGALERGEHVSTTGVVKAVYGFGTQGHGYYYTTPINNFPGEVTAEAPLGCGFEGVYIDNQNEFSGALPKCGKPVNNIPPEDAICPFYPDAVVVKTDSPVEITIINPEGKKVQTSGNQITVQELGKNIVSFVTPHEDGTYGWTIVLPKDDYDIELTGVKDGNYTLTLTTYDNEDQAVDQVTQSSITANETVSYKLEAPKTVQAEITNEADHTTAKTSGGGVGTLSLLMLLSFAIRRRLKAK